MRRARALASRIGPVTSSSLALVLLAAALHASWNAVAKGGRDPLVFLWLSNCVSATALAPVAVALLVAGETQARAAPFVVASAALHALYFYALGRAYRSGQFSVVYPVARGLGVALVPLLAFAAFGERLSAIGALGVGLVVVGILGLHAIPHAAAAAGGGRWLGPATGWAILTGLTVATYSVVDKAGAGRVSPVVYMAFLEAGTAVLLAPAVARASQGIAEEWRARWGTILFAGLASPIAYTLILYAFQTAKTGYVVAAREFSIVLSALIGSLLLGEGRLWPRLAGASVVLAGVACVAVAR
jgi:uncharacterized membrane protein